MTYSKEIQELLKACGHEATIYDHDPTKDGDGPIRPLNNHDRRRVDRVSYPERGYRRFTAERMSAV